jgi:diguanylate cyclase (GGDEF)-like protein
MHRRAAELIRSGEAQSELMRSLTKREESYREIKGALKESVARTERAKESLAASEQSVADFKRQVIDRVVHRAGAFQAIDRDAARARVRARDVRAVVAVDGDAEHRPLDRRLAAVVQPDRQRVARPGFNLVGRRPRRRGRRGGGRRRNGDANLLVVGGAQQVFHLRLGHPVLDPVVVGLADFAPAAQDGRECRQEDVACRYGGEEFALIMPDTAPVAALKVCERIRIAMTEIAWARHPERTITLSIGLTGASAKANLTPVNWLELADQNLYLAKRSGRNRVIMTEADPKLRLAVG